MSIMLTLETHLASLSYLLFINVVMGLRFVIENSEYAGLSFSPSCKERMSMKFRVFRRAKKRTPEGTDSPVVA